LRWHCGAKFSRLKVATQVLSVLLHFGVIILNSIVSHLLEGVPNYAQVLDNLITSLSPLKRTQRILNHLQLLTLHVAESGSARRAGLSHFFHGLQNDLGLNGIYVCVGFQLVIQHKQRRLELCGPAHDSAQTILICQQSVNIGDVAIDQSQRALTSGSVCALGFFEVSALFDRIKARLCLTETICTVAALILSGRCALAL